MDGRNVGAFPEGGGETSFRRWVRFLGFGKRDGARWYYGDMNTPNEVMVRFGCRKNYIGQLEILAAVAVYFSMPELRGRRVLHWIDNTGAIAALTKGYARAPNSVRIVHVFN